MEQEEYNKLLQEFKEKLEGLSNTKNSLDSSISEAVKKLDELKHSSESSQALQKSISDIEKNVKIIQQTIDKTSKSAEIKLNEVELFHSQEYLPLRDKILNESTGLQSALTNAQQKNTEVENLNTLANTHFENLKTSIDQYNNTLASLKDAHATLNSFFATSKSSAEDQLDLIRVVKDDTDKLLQVIKNTERQTQEAKVQIDNLLGDSKSTNESILKIKEDAETIKKKINTIYEQANDDTLGGAFGNQVTFLHGELTKWEKKIQLWTLGLLTTILAIFLIQCQIYSWDLTNVGAAFYLRFTFTTPLIFYIAFCTKQYSNIRTSLDRYTFKKNMTLSVEAHTELLEISFPDREEERLRFSLDVLHKVYDIPYYDESMQMRDKITLEEIKFGVPRSNAINYHPNGNTKKNDAFLNGSSKKEENKASEIE